jgi:hypothetical protein
LTNLHRTIIPGFLIKKYFLIRESRVTAARRAFFAQGADVGAAPNLLLLIVANHCAVSGNVAGNLTVLRILMRAAIPLK